MKDITTEEAIKILEEFSTFDYVKLENGDVAIEKVLKELNSKKGTINALQEALKERTDERDKKDETINKKDKIINAMASYISEFDNDETICKGIDCYDQIYGCRTCIKQYFERKVKDE